MSDTLTVNIPSEVTTAEAPNTPETAQAISLIPAEQTNELPDDPEQASPEQAAEVLPSKGLDVSAFENEYAENGSLSVESYQKLADAGLNKDMVDRYIQASTIIADTFVTEMKGLAGGDAGYEAMSEWARGSLDTKEIESFNKVTASGDLEMTRLVVAGLYARYQASEGRNPDLVSGRAASASSGQSSNAFRSTQEVVAAMRDPRYGKDPAYTHDVEQRMARSNVF